MPIITLRATLVLLLTVLLSACGQKGPLYLPDAPNHTTRAQNSLSPETHL